MAGRVLSSLKRAAREHWLFLVLLSAGVALRAVALFAYRPALFSPDSALYLDESTDLEPSPNWPLGYATLLRLLPLEQSLAVVPLVQHLLGLAVAVLIYTLMLRLGVRRWLAAVAAAPVLLDAYQVNIEQYVLSEVLFELLLIGAAALLLWRRPPGISLVALAGGVLALAALTRAIGVLAVVPALVTVLLVTAGSPWRDHLSRAGAFLGVFALAVGGYVVWYHSVQGTYSLAGHAGQRLYGRVVPWVECSEFSVRPYERPLCPAQPVGSRPRVFRLVWAPSSPLRRVEPPADMTRSQVASQFARRAIRNQPATYARAVAADFLTSFSPTRETRPGGYRVAQWQFQTSFPIPGFPATWSTTPPAGFGNGESRGSIEPSLASFLRTYQRFGYAPGPLLALGLLAGLAAVFAAWRAGDVRLRSAAFLFVGLTFAICLGSLALVPFSWRYQLPQLILLPPALALGVTALTERLRARPQAHDASRAPPQPRPSVD